MSLGAMTEEFADGIIEYRQRQIIEELHHPFQQISNYFEWISLYTAILPFVATANTPANIPARPNFTVNINTATRDRLVFAGLTTAQANALITQRDMYHIKSLYEISSVTGLNFSEAAVNVLSDNLTTRTDINNATEYEIRSLLNVTGSNADVTAIMRNRPFTDLMHLRNNITAATFAAIEPFIVLGGQYTDLVNVNTATAAQLTALGLNSSQVNEIRAAQRNMLQPRNLPAAALTVMDRITMITNINIATSSELATLGTFMTQDVINDIIAYRNDQPFGSRAEIQQFFADRQMLTQYRQIERFMHVR
jgi:DNA uptake protein ComE-like DNA-binding protein